MILTFKPKSFFFLAAVDLPCCTRAFIHCRLQASHCGGFSFCGTRAPGPRDSAVAALRLSSRGSRDLELGLNSGAAWAQLLDSMWDLPRPGIEPRSPSLAGESYPLYYQGSPKSQVLSEGMRDGSQ